MKAEAAGRDFVTRTNILIVGTGFGGLATAHYLQKSGEQDLLLLERKADVGGVWRDNAYPGCACDVQSHLYSFSFAPNPDWTRQFSPQAEIHAYLRKVAIDLGLMPKIRFNHEVTRMDWDELAGEWRVATTQGLFRARHVVGAFGSLSDPDIPGVKGLENFGGQVFHSATWPRDFDPKGKRVAVLGTGASAIQFVPAIQPEVASLQLYQRTAPWIMPRHDGPISEATREAYRRAPLLQRAERMRIYTSRESMAVGFRNPAIMRLVQRGAVKHLHQAVTDPALRRKLTPDYTLGCKRILISNTYYPALAQPNVEVHAESIREITRDGVVGDSGLTRQVDAIIFGTGFKARDLPFADIIHDGAGQSLAAAWQGSPKAYMGTTVHGFPNLYLLHGPNIGLGHTSVIYMFEAQARHVAGVIRLARRRGYDIIEPTSMAQAGFVEQIERDMKGTVWTAGGCTSWYLDRTGRNSSLWPGYTFTYSNRAKRISERDYQGRSARR